MKNLFLTLLCLFVLSSCGEGADEPILVTYYFASFPCGLNDGGLNGMTFVYINGEGEEVSDTIKTCTLTINTNMPQGHQAYAGALTVATGSAAAMTVEMRFNGIIVQSAKARGEDAETEEGEDGSTRVTSPAKGAAVTLQKVVEWPDEGGDSEEGASGGSEE